MAEPKIKSNGHVPQKPVPSGPSKKTRDEYLRKVREITKNRTKKKPQSPASIRPI